MGVAVDGGEGIGWLKEAGAQIGADAVELLLEDGVVQPGGGDGLRTGELLVELNAQLVPGSLASEGHGVEVEVVCHGMSFQTEEGPALRGQYGERDWSLLV